MWHNWLRLVCSLTCTYIVQRATPPHFRKFAEGTRSIQGGIVGSTLLIQQIRKHQSSGCPMLINNTNRIIKMYLTLLVKSHFAMTEIFSGCFLLHKMHHLHEDKYCCILSPSMYTVHKYNIHIHKHSHASTLLYTSNSMITNLLPIANKLPVKTNFGC